MYTYLVVVVVDVDITHIFFGFVIKQYEILVQHQTGKKIASPQHK